MIKARALVRPAVILGFITTIISLAPPALRAQATQDGKFVIAANARAALFTNGTSLNQTVLATICVTTSGSQAAVVEIFASGIVVDTLTNVRLGQCRSVSAELTPDQSIAVRAPAVNIAGNYLISVHLP
jgi:hypothetical protein